MNKKDKTVFVGVSGGVDSSVSAALLKEEGYNVVGVFIKVWQPDFLPCEWEKERIDAIRVCVRLDIPFMTLDLEKEYKEEVADYMISEYKIGRTPNPDVMCNKYIKFGSFLSFAKENGADYIATGHYARIVESKKLKVTTLFPLVRSSLGNKKCPCGESKNGSEFKLLQGVDDNKDQTYFLWTLTQKELGSVLFPVGKYKKDKVRKLAKKYDLLTAEKKDSQGICFLGQVDLEEFLGHYLDLKEGEVLNTKGEAVGVHSGAEIYTMGQRHGFTIDEKDTEREPYYVVSKDIEKNTVTVSHEQNDKDFNKKEISLEGVNWITSAPKEGKEYTARIRHRGELHPCTVSGNSVSFKEPQYGLAVGQSLVLFDEEECIGGGIVS
ncbi:tRNA 2-thiouridine(34) synthase MnmA [candidate division KSB1 bacterium]